MNAFAHKDDKSKINLGNESDLTGIGDGTAFGAIKAIKNDLTAVEGNNGLVDISGYVDITANINQNSSFTAPADGLYIFTLSGDGTNGGGIYANSARSKLLAINAYSKEVHFTLPMKTGSTIYTRASYGSYKVRGYMPFL